MSRRWTDQDRTRAMAALELNGGNVSLTGKQLDIPRRTIALWRDHAIDAGAQLPVPADRQTDWQAVREEAAGVFLDLARDAAGVIATQLQHYRDEDRPLKPHEIREVATAMGIASDKAAHLLFGPQGVAITVDARQRTLGLPAGMTVEEARELAAALRPPPAPHAAGATLE